MTTQLTHDTELVNVYPLTDGQTTIYVKRTLGNGTMALAINSGSGEQILMQRPLFVFDSGGWQPQPYSSYQVAGGWVAFVAAAENPRPYERYVWTRSPDGVQRQVTPAPADYYLKSLAPNGELLFIDWYNKQEIYLAVPGRETLRLAVPAEPQRPLWACQRNWGGRCFGRGFWEDGHWYLVVDGTLYRLETSDATPPVLTLPEPLTTAATTPEGAVITYTAGATDLIDGAVNVACNPASGSVFPIGMTTVECSATDAAGNQALGSFAVTVEGAAAQIADLEAAVRGLGPPGNLGVLAAQAGRLVQDGKDLAACALLGAFTLHVRIYDRGGSITTSEADQLSSDASRILAVLGCRP